MVYLSYYSASITIGKRSKPSVSLDYARYLAASFCIPTGMSASFLRLQLPSFQPRFPVVAVGYANKDKLDR